MLFGDRPRAPEKVAAHQAAQMQVDAIRSARSEVGKARAALEAQMAADRISAAGGLSALSPRDYRQAKAEMLSRLRRSERG